MKSQEIFPGKNEIAVLSALRDIPYILVITGL